MMRSILIPQVAGRSLDELQPALNFFRALGFAAGKEWHQDGSKGIAVEAPGGTIGLIAGNRAPNVDLIVEVDDAEAAWLVAKEQDVKVLREISDAPAGSRFFEVESAGMRLRLVTEARKVDAVRGIEAPLNAAGKRFGVVVSRFNSFITERLLDGALQALRQTGANPDDITIAHVAGAFEIPSAARKLAETGRYQAIVCIGCLLRGSTLHYEVLANEVTRGVGQSAQETGVPHAFGVLTCDTLEQAIDRDGLKMGNKGFEAGLSAIEMA
jgi:6,7-dimethyl-8-ribityllumazine synthase